MQAAPSTRAQVIQSCFRPEQGNGELIIHVKINEQTPALPNAPQAAPTESKPRYILLAVTPDGKLKLHKSKRNSNGTFSIGKTWGLEELMALEVAQPTAFAITLNAKSYLWETDSPAEQINFLVAIVRCFRQYTGRTVRVVGFEVNERPGAPPPYVVPVANGLVPPARPRLPTNPSAASTASQGSIPPPRPVQPPPSSVARPERREVTSNGSTMPRPAPSSPYNRPDRNDVISNGSSVVNRRSRLSPAVSEPAASIRSQTSAAASRHQPSPSTSRHQPTPSTSKQADSAPPRQIKGKISSPIVPGQAAFDSPAPLPSKPIPEKQSEELPNAIPIPVKLRAEPPPKVALLEPPPPSDSPTEEQAFSRPSPRRGNTSHDRDVPQSARTVQPTPEEDLTTLANVDEMLEGFQWGGVQSGEPLGAADQIEKSLAGELAALEAASIHAIVESDDRVNFVIKHLDQAMAELERLEQMISLYKSQLNVMIDDIDHIESQNKGLQVQTSNQRSLLAELDKLLDTINIPEVDLQALAQESLESKNGIERLEKAAVSLYKAILSMRDTAVGDMAAASERFGEYHRYSSQFCKRVFDFLAVMFKYQADMANKENDRMGPKSIAVLQPHKQFETYLERYVGLMLFIKEIDDQRYNQICSAYFATTSELYQSEIGKLLSFSKSLIRKPTEEELESSFTHAIASPSLRSGMLKRAATTRSPALDGKKSGQGEQLQSGEAFRRALIQIDPHIVREQQFVADLLHLTGMDTFVTFADFMELEIFFRRGAAAHMAENYARFKDLRSSLDLIFGFLNQELSEFIDSVVEKDPVQIIGVLVAIEVTIPECQASANDFLNRALQKQAQRCAAVLDQLIRDQAKAIEQTRLTLKKRKGIAPFVNIFPHFADRIESQLVDAQNLPVRRLVDEKYDVLVSTMFECLQQMAKMDGESGAQSEDKDQLNYHVVLIENMSHFLAVARDLRIPALSPHLKRARDIYEENLGLYIRLILRRPFAKLSDFFGGLEQQLRTTPANEVGLHSAYNKSSAKKAAGSLSVKDMRKAVEALSKRVDKHFSDVSNPTSQSTDILRTVWQACRDEATKMVTSWLTHIKRCYPETNVSLDFTPDDLIAAFNRNKPTGTAT